MQLFVKTTRTLVLEVCSDDTGSSLSQAVQAETGLPEGSFWLSCGGRCLKDDKPLRACGVSPESTIQVVHRLLGGKGGFGALLRGAGRAALTDNFDACRDLNGRRLRHVNADKKLAEWAAEAKERQLEKLAMKHLRDQERERNKAEKAQVNMEGVKAEQNRALAGVMAALNDGFASEVHGQKRKASGAEDETAKRRKFLETLLEGDDSDDSPFDSEDEQLAEAAIAEWLSGRDSATMGPYSQDGAGPSSDSDVSAQEPQPSLASERVQQATLEAAADRSATEPQPPATQHLLSANHPTSSPASTLESTQQAPADASTDADQPAAAAPTAADPRSAPDATASNADARQAAGLTLAGPVDLQTYASAADLQQLGLDVLKQQLQLRGLKCGGSLAERAARLFILKETSLADLDKKHFPKGKK